MKGLVFLLCILTVNGHTYFRDRIPNGRNVTHPCPGKGVWSAVGHMEAYHTQQKNVFGLDFRKSGLKWSKELCMRDSDGDGLTNGEELGDPGCVWKSGVIAGKVMGHPGFCEQDRPDCKSGMTYRDCKNPNAKGKMTKKALIQLPPGANEHPQTRKWKEMMRNRHNLNRLPQRRPYQPRAPTSNDITRTTVPSHLPVRNIWSQSGQPIVGQSVFGQGLTQPRNSNSYPRGSFNNRGRHVQQQRSPIILTRDFGLNVGSNDESSLHTTPVPRINHIRSSGRLNSRLGDNGMNPGRRAFNRSHRRRNTGSINSAHQRPSSFSRAISHWSSPSDPSSMGRNFVPDQSRHRINSGMQSNIRHGSQTAFTNSLVEIPDGQSMAHLGRPMAYPTIPRVIRPGIHNAQVQGVGMRFPPF